jgi:hypothetical protein
MAKLIAKLTNTAKHFKREPDIISQPANIVAMVQSHLPSKLWLD